MIAANDDIPRALLQEAIAYDWVILQATRRRTMSGLEMDDVTTSVIQELSCSPVMLGSNDLDLSHPTLKIGFQEGNFCSSIPLFQGSD